jgi:hypothetical protein
MGGADRDGVKGMVAAAHAALKGQLFEDEELVAEGDAAFARFNQVLTFPDGSTTSARTIAYDRICLRWQDRGQRRDVQPRHDAGPRTAPGTSVSLTLAGLPGGFLRRSARCG